MNVRVLLLVAVAAAGMLLPGGADVLADEHGNDDHDRARELFEHGEIHSLREILKRVAQQLDGEVVSVDLMQIKERWVYRVQIVDRDGRRTFVDVDAGADVDLDNEDEDHD
ncbi:MAG TPA: PepSY domain-containing protein [Devosia sp.]